MSTTRTVTRRFPNALLPVLAAGVLTAVAQAAPPGDAKDLLLPRARLLQKFSDEVYRIPVLLDTDQGPRLLLWVDAFDPEPPSRIPGLPMPQPQFDLIFWDVAASKELHRMSYPKEAAPLSPLPASMSSAAAILPFGRLAFTPDGKQLAHLSTTYKIIPGKPVHEASTVIQLVDSEKGKAEPAVATVYKGDFPQVLFAPDGALVILTDTSCAVQELGKPKPRLTIDLARSAAHKAVPGLGAIYDVAVAPDGALLAVAADGMVTVYDLATGKRVFDAERAAPEFKTTFRQQPAGSSLAFAPGGEEPKLLAVERVAGPPKDFVLARLIDLKAKKEAGRWMLAERENKPAPAPQTVAPWGGAHAAFTAKGEPRIFFDGKLIDGASGKVLERFDEGFGVSVSRDARYLVRRTRTKDEKKMRVEVWGLEEEK
jgi:hypothetical protein